MNSEESPGPVIIIVVDHYCQVKRMFPFLSNVFAKHGYQALGQREGKNQFRPNDQNFGRQAFEESTESLVLHDVFDDHDSTLLGFKVLVLYPSFDDVQWLRNGDG